MSRSRASVAALVASLLATAVAWSPVARPAPVAATVGPIAQWTFDAGSGATAADATGNGHTGSFIGSPTWVTSGAAQGAGAMAFDGDDGLTIAAPASLEPAAITVTAWVRGSGFDAPAAILSKGANADCSVQSYRLYASSAQTQADGLTFIVGSGGGGIGGGLWDGTWHHIAVQYSVADNQSSLYQDGVFRGGGGAGNPQPITYGLADGGLRIGLPLADCSGQLGFVGALDDVRIYDRLLSAQEIVAFIPPVTTSTTVALSTAAAVYPDDVTFTATVTPKPKLGGTVTFWGKHDGGGEQELGSGYIDPATGQGSYTTGGIYAELQRGTWEIQARYGGYGAYQASDSGWETVTVAGSVTTLFLLSNMDPQPVGRHATLEAGIQPGNATGTVTFYRIDGQDRIQLGQAPLIQSPYVSPPVSSAVLAFPGDLGLGSYPLVAVYGGDSTHAPTESEILVQDVGPRPTQATAIVTGFRDPPTTVRRGDHVFVTNDLADFGGYISNPIPFTGEVTVRVDGLAVGTVDPNTSFELSTSALAVGSHSVDVTYPGSTDHGAATSPGVTLTILADIVEATGVTVSSTSIYPYKDGYRDSVSIRGVRQEPASVSIKVYSPTNKVVRSASVSRATGSYSYAWNGRTSTGAMLAAGKYRVVQLLTDAAGTRKSVTSYVTLSSKRVVYSTVTITRTFSQATKRTSSWGGWQFTMPSAAVYKSISFGVYANATIGGGSFGGQDFARCHYSTTWSYGCVTRVGAVGPSVRWHTRSLHTTYDRYGRTVRGYVWANPGGTVNVGKVRLVVTYGVLK